jgi:photosystem II stability/assembly factor-like uncharacterized protein
MYSLAVHPRHPRVVWAGIQGAVIKSLDGGVTFLKPGAGLPEYMETWALVVDPHRPRVLYAGTDGNGVYKSRDGGAHWKSARAGLPVGYSIYALAIDRRHRLYAGGPGGLYVSTNGARSWKRIVAGMDRTSTAALALDRTRTVLYAGTGREDGGGVFTARAR